MESKCSDETWRMRFMNLCILRMLEDTVSLGEAHIMTSQNRRHCNRNTFWNGQQHSCWGVLTRLYWRKSLPSMLIVSATHSCSSAYGFSESSVDQHRNIHVLAFTKILVYALHTMYAKRRPSLFVKANTRL